MKTTQKMVNKSKAWARHGKHKGVIIAVFILDQMKRSKPKPYKPYMFSTVAKAMAAARKHNP